MHSSDAVLLLLLLLLTPLLCNRGFPFAVGTMSVMYSSERADGVRGDNNKLPGVCTMLFSYIVQVRGRRSDIFGGILR